MRTIDADEFVARMHKHVAGFDQDSREWLISVADVQRILLEVPTVEPKREWVSVKDRLPDNANHPGCFCPRYIVYTDYGITEGWYNPDSGCWYGFLTFMTEEYSRWNIDLKRGDVPKTVKNLPVRYWMPFPEPPKMEGGETDETD